MALRIIGMAMALILVSMLLARAAAQSGCTSVLIGMAPCLNYVTGSSSTPSSSCCSQLASVVQSQPQCLCKVLSGGGAALGITINQTLALALPGACNVQTPPVSQCNAANGPASPPLLPQLVHRKLYLVTLQLVHQNQELDLKQFQRLARALPIMSLRLILLSIFMAAAN